MKKALKVFGALVGLLVILAGGFVAVMALRSPASRLPSTEQVQATPERLARGRYLAYNLVGCLGCHSDFIADKWGMPIKPGSEGGGGFVFDEKLGVPGVVAAQNLTPDPEYGKANWTDGEIMRAFREGVSKDGHALFPMMPYRALRNMSDEDARSVVAFLRTLKPLHNQIPPTKINFPVNLFIKSAPQPLTAPVPHPDDTKDHMAYAKYVVTLADCRFCHSPHDPQQNVIPGKEFSGGWEMVGPWGRVRTANLTPHPDAYLGQATKEQFIARFKAFAGMADDLDKLPAPAKGTNTVMPWIYYAGLTEQDLGAIYDYLKAQPAIKNDVVKFPDAPQAGPAKL